jgi:hypothetical protein
VDALQGIVCGSLHSLIDRLIGTIDGPTVRSIDWVAGRGALLALEIERSIDRSGLMDGGLHVMMWMQQAAG